MEFPSEDFFKIRQLLAESHGKEITPEELRSLFENVTGEPLSLTNEPGITSFLKNDK